MRFFTHLAVLAVVLLSTFTTKAATVVVTVGNNFYSPQTVNIVVGDVVRFQWQAGSHPTQSDSSPAAWPTFPMDASNTTRDITLTTPGTYPYHCQAHGAPNSGQFGTIVVAQATPAPTITGFSPASGPVGTTVTITGTGFTGALAVRFNGTNAASFNVVSTTSITAVVPSGATSGTITVSGSGAVATSGNSFTVTQSPPAVNSFAPTSGPAGTVVTLTGANFTGATAVRFNGTNAASFNVVSATSITATVPAGATSGTISVDGPGGTTTSNGSFTVTASAPAVTSFAPTAAPVGATVTITGTNFTGATAVRFNGISAASFNVVSATSITAVVPTGATSGAITVVTPGGTATSTSSFSVTLATRASSVANAALYPNPSKGIVTINLNDKAGTHYQLVLHNVIGQPLRTFVLDGATEQRLDLSALPAGVYFYSLLADNKVVSTKRLTLQ